LFPFIESVHVVAICLVVGSIFALDLRLLGFASVGRPVSRLANAILPVTWAAFAIAATSGFLLFISNATKYLANGYFDAKIILICAAGATDFKQGRVDRIFRDDATEADIPESSRSSARSRRRSPRSRSSASASSGCTRAACWSILPRCRWVEPIAQCATPPTRPSSSARRRRISPFGVQNRAMAERVSVNPIERSSIFDLLRPKPTI
jgi:hypothetical protein